MTGADPNTAWLEGCMLLDDKSFVKTGAEILPEDLISAHWPMPRRPYLMETSIPGVFCVGDVRSSSVKRVASAVGRGLDLRAAGAPGAGGDVRRRLSGPRSLRALDEAA